MLKKSFLFLVSIITFLACNSTEETDPVAVNSFDRSALLTNIADNIIIPSYAAFSTKMTSLKQAGETFTNAPSQNNLDALRISWLAAYKTWQQVEMFDIGKAEELQYKFYMNIYPLTVADVEANIAKGTYNLNSVNNHDAQGFAALDYLLHGVAVADSAILAKYTIGANKENYKKYLTDVLQQMDTLTSQVVSSFSAQKNTFIGNTSNTLSGSVNQLVNDYIFYYEKGLRANKIGIPAGVFSSTPLPEKVEGFYKNTISKELALEALLAVQNLFEGKAYGSTAVGVGFKTYLVSLNREDIANSISNQFVKAKAEINKLDASFSTQIEADNTAMTKAYDELQKVVVLLKVDMLQAFNISVDYVDADGD